MQMLHLTPTARPIASEIYEQTNMMIQVSNIKFLLRICNYLQRNIKKMGTFTNKNEYISTFTQG